MLREDAEIIIEEAICQVMPDEAVVRALEGKEFGSGKIYLVSVGKAAWQMAKTAADLPGTAALPGFTISFSAIYWGIRLI